MKSIILKIQIACIFFLFSFSSALAGGHWELIRKADWIFPLRSVVFVDSLHGWIISDWANLLYTDDGGRHWTEHSFRRDMRERMHYFEDIAFVNKKVGWIVGYGGQILKTIDGGKNWFFQISNISLDLTACSFVDTLRGWAVGFDGIIIHTRDGGRTWEQQSIRQNPMLNDVCFVDSLNGWAVGRQSMIMHTTDGGKTWEKKSLGTGNIFAHIFFLNRRIGWVVGDWATIAKTTDGGQTWTVHKRISGNNELLSSVFFINENVGWVVGGYYTNTAEASGERVFLKTTDGGESWLHQGDLRRESLHDVYFVNDSLGWAVGLFGTILHTHNAGKTWQWQMNFPSDILNNIYFVDDKNGWAGGKYTLIHTTDGGNTWSFIDTMQAWDVFFHNRQKGWIADGPRGIYHTEDGGKSWYLQYNGYVGQVQFYSENFGRAFANPPDSSYGIYTTDGGKTWRHLFTIYDKELLTYCFLDSLHGWAGGGEDAIWHTTDGGFHWELQRESPGEITAIFDITFVDTLYGWAVGYFGKIYHTKDGGKTWGRQLSHTDADLAAIHFFNRNEGWIVGLFGTILHTTDGGQTWDSSYSFEDYSRWMYDVCFTDKNLGWAVGPYGAVYKWTGTDAVQSRPKVTIPEILRLYPTYPNPFSPLQRDGKASIQYALPLSSTVIVRIFNELGQEVRTIRKKRQQAGIHTLMWDGRDNAGEILPAGTYFYQIQAGHFVATKKLLLLK